MRKIRMTSIILRPVTLMMDHEVGVTSRILKLPKLDVDVIEEQ